MRYVDYTSLSDTAVRILFSLEHSGFGTALCYYAALTIPNHVVPSPNQSTLLPLIVNREGQEPLPEKEMNTARNSSYQIQSISP